MGRVGFDVRDTQSRQDGDLFPTINAPLHCLCHLSWPLSPHQCSSSLPLPSLPVSPSISGAAVLLSNKASIRSSFLGVHRVGSHKQVFRLALPSVWLRLNLCLLWGLLRACFRDEYYSYIKKNYFFCPFTCSWICEWFAALGLLKIELVWATTYWFRLAINFIFPFCFGQMSRDGKAGPFSQCVFNFLRNWSSLWASHLAFSSPVRENSSPIRNILN